MSKAEEEKNRCIDAQKQYTHFLLLPTILPDNREKSHVGILLAEHLM